MINRQSFFDQLVKNDLIICGNTQNIPTGSGDDWLVTRLSYFKEHYKMIAIDLSKQQAIDADSKIIQKINFT